MAIKPMTLLLVACFSAMSPAEQAVADNVEEIIRALQGRRSEAATAKVMWDQQVFTPQDSMTSFLAMIPDAKRAYADVLGADPDGPLPPEDRVHLERVLVTLDGNKVRVSFDDAAYDKWSRVSTFDGHTSQKLDVGGTNGFPFGLIDTGSYSQSVTLVDCKPLIFLLRPFDADFRGLSESGWIQHAVSTEPDGTVVLLLTKEGGKSGGDEWMWVEKRLFRIARYETRSEGHVRLRIDFAFNSASDNSFAPTGWTIRQWTKSGKLEREVKSHVRTFELNASIPEDVFQIDFPKGTLVSNLSTNKEYIVQEGSKLREISGSERSLSYQELRDKRIGRFGSLRTVIAVFVVVISLSAVLAWILGSRAK